MKTKLYYLFILILMISSCEIEDQVNPNNPALEDILIGATKTDLNNLVTGSLSTMRNSHDGYVNAYGLLARELYVFDADPRNKTDLLGIGVTSLDNNTFYTTGPWNQRYRTIKNLNILIEATNNADVEVSEAEKAGYIGFANTLLAHQFLMLINAQDENGIRLDVSDPENLGPIVTKEVAFSRIVELLNEGATQISGAEFAMVLTSGFNNFNTAETFLEFNKALLARVELYRENYSASLTALDNSFFDLMEKLDIGPKMIYSTAGGDQTNGLFKSPQQSGDQIVVNNDWIEDAETGDLRVANKAALRDNPTSTGGGLNGTHETRLYSSTSSPIDIIRNEELILIYAEAKINLNQLTDAVTALNIIRTAAGLPDLATAKPGIINDQDLLLDELLNQRRYSLWSEGHRAIDLRRYDRLNRDFVEIDVIFDEDGEEVPQIIFERFPIPATENI